MGFNISMRTASAFDRNTILQQGQIKQAYTSANIGQGGEVRRQNPVQPSASASRPAVQSSAPVNRPSAPAIPPLPYSSTLLRRGQKFTIADKNGSVPSVLKLKLDWQVGNPQCDLDASAFLLGQNDKVPAEEWFVFYGQPNSPDNSIRYSGNTGTGAEMLINLNQISPQIQKIAFAVTIYEAIQQRLHFGMVQNVTARIFNQINATELARIDLTDCSAGITALVVGELYRYKGDWKFNAVGSGVARDLAGFCAMYGIEAG
ncbi:MAG: TerD family protein [Oscillospiraceae bacterium]|nr:TerD family protein [Oscillospiraceae bacterium]